VARIARLGMLCGVIGFVFSLSAHAQNMGICAGWVPDSSSYCTSATPSLDIGSTGNSNPTFNIAVNGTGSTQSTDLVVLIPTSGAATNLTFTATFQAYDSNGTAVGSPVVVNATAASMTPFMANSGGGNNAYLLSTYLGLTVANGQDYHFNSILGVESLGSTTGFTTYMLQTPIALLGQAAGGGYVTVSFSNFSNGSGFPVGTIFLALGNDANGNIIYNTPLTQGLETVPEPLSLGLFGTGLLGIALAVRRRMRNETEHKV
jgi:hypothetical protein